MGIVAAVAGVNLAVTAPGASAAPAAGNAASINEVDCNNNEFVKLTTHNTDDRSIDECYANGGIMYTERPWVTEIWTGNNQVQWYGDGKWQPFIPIGKNTHFAWPHNPGGVTISKIRIV